MRIKTRKNASSNVVGVEVHDENSEVIDVSTGTSVSAKGILQIVEVELVTPGHSRKVFALCDTGSTNSWISKEFCTDLKLSRTPIQMSVKGINTKEHMHTEQVEVEVRPISVQSSVTFSA